MWVYFLTIWLAQLACKFFIIMKNVASEQLASQWGNVYFEGVPPSRDLCFFVINPLVASLRPAAWELHVCSALRFWLFNKGVCFCVLSIYIFTLILPGNPSIARFTFKRKHRRKLNKFNYLKICSTCSVFRMCSQINWYNKRQKEAFRMCLSAICL